MNDVPNYELLKELGSGSFGIVYLARDKRSNAHVAIKRVEKKGELLSREYQVLDAVRKCQHCVSLLEFFYTKDSRGHLIQNMVFEYMPSNLEHYLQAQKKKKKPISEENAKLFLYQILNGLKELHDRGIVHRDLKPENILMDDAYLKLADFGSSKFMDDQTVSTPYIVSRYYRAPELLLCVTDYTSKIDIWAAGCIFAELALGEPVFKGTSDGDQLFSILTIMGSFTRAEKAFYLQKSPFAKELIGKFPKFKQDKKVLSSWFSRMGSKDEALDLALKLLALNPTDRPSAEEALAFPFFDSVRAKPKRKKSFF